MNKIINECINKHNLFESIFMPDYTGLCERFESRPGWPCRHPLQQLPQEVSSPPSWKSVYKMLVLLPVPALRDWGQLRVSVTPWNYQGALESRLASLCFCVCFLADR